MTGQHLCQGAGLEFKKGCVCMQDMLFTYTVLASIQAAESSRQEDIWYHAKSMEALFLFP